MKEEKILLDIGGRVTKVVRHVVIEKGEKVRVYPMKMRREEDLLSGDWLYNPEKVKKGLAERLKIEHPTWISKGFRLDPGLNNVFYHGKPMIESASDELVFAVVIVPRTEDDDLFTSQRDVHF